MVGTALAAWLPMGVFINNPEPGVLPCSPANSGYEAVIMA